MMSFPLPSKETITLPGGGIVRAPRGYKPDPLKDERWRAVGVLILYRHLRSMLSGTMECNGVIAIARRDAHADIDDFVNAARGALTTRWAHGHEQGWGDSAKRLPVERRTATDGVELSGALSVHVVGFWDVYDWPGRFLALEHACGLRVAVWIWDKHGGEKRARAMVNAIARSYRGGVEA